MQKKLIGQYNLIQVIGKGGYANVYKATDNNGSLVAIKEIPLASMQAEIIPYMRNEVRLLRTANNKNIVRLIKDFEFDKKIYLILEYCEMDVKKMADKFQKILHKDLIIEILKQIVNGITFLHGQNIIHRDSLEVNLITNSQKLIQNSSIALTYQFSVALLIVLIRNFIFIAS